MLVFVGFVFFFLNPTQIYQNMAKKKNPVHSIFLSERGHNGRNFTRTTSIIRFPLFNWFGAKTVIDFSLSAGACK